jgi:hypothetical protein
MAHVAEPKLAPASEKPKQFLLSSETVRRMGARVQRAALAFSSNAFALTAAYTLLVIPVTIAIAARRSFWFDEIYTVYLAHLTPSQLWQALLAAADQMPPMFDLITRWMFAAFGQSTLVARTPSVIAYWFAGLCVFRFVSFRTAPVWGFLAALLPFATGSAYYASEARPYSLLVAFTALAMAAWQSAAAGHRRKLSLFLLAAAIFLAVNSHYYAVLLVIPFFCGEAVRAWRTKRIDWHVLACVTLPYSILFLFLPFIRHSERLLSDHAWNRPSLSSLYEAYPYVFGSVGPIIWAVLIASVAVFYFSRRATAAHRTEEPQPLPPAHETVAALALTLLPVPAFIAAITATHMIYPRYVLEIVVGAAILFGFACYQLGRGSVTYALTGCAIIGVFIVASCIKSVRNMPSATEGCPVVAESGATTSWPVVVDDTKIFLRCYYYSNPEMKSRLRFVSGPKEAIALGLGNSLHRLMLVAGRVFHVPVVPYEVFRARHRHFYLEQGTEAAWVLQQYLHNGASIQMFRRPGMFIVNDDKGEWTGPITGARR